MIIVMVRNKYCSKIGWVYAGTHDLRRHTATCIDDKMGILIREKNCGALSFGESTGTPGAK
jgi:hypothetical protein